jgi:AcrR family transcriptional regulator
MGKKLGLTLDDVIQAATEIADEAGVESLNLAAVAERLGVRSPSLYHHVQGLDGLRRELAKRGAQGLMQAFASAASGLRGKKALLALGRSYRAFARKHPGLLGAMLPAPRVHDDAELYQALAAPVAEVVRALSDLGIAGDDAIHVVRSLRAYLHGFVELERRGGFGMPQKLETSFERGLRVFVDGIN